MPYGSRGRDIIVQYARQDIRFLLQKDVKFIIAACGTVSSTYPPERPPGCPCRLPALVGATAPRLVDADAEPQNRHYRHGSPVHWRSYAAIIPHDARRADFCPRLPDVFAAELERLLQRRQPGHKAIIAEYLQGAEDAGVDTLILGCTHYPC